MNKTYQRKKLQEISEFKDRIREKYKDEIEVKCLNDEVLLFVRYYVDELKEYIESRPHRMFYVGEKFPVELKESMLAQIPEIREKTIKIAKELRGEIITTTAPRYIASGILAYVVKPTLCNRRPSAPVYLLTLHEIACEITNTTEPSIRNNMKHIENYIKDNNIEL